MTYIVTRLRERSKDPRHSTEFPQGTKAKAFPPATEKEVKAAERALGFELPPLLREVYTQVGNGGFGPVTGLLQLVGAAADDKRRTIVELYHSLRESFPNDWPAKLLPVADWGCQGYACLDCSQKETPVLQFHTSCHSLEVEKLSFKERLTPVADSFRDWMTAWLDKTKR
jgi:hypothetical protein